MGDEADLGEESGEAWDVDVVGEVGEVIGESGFWCGEEGREEEEDN